MSRKCGFLVLIVMGWAFSSFAEYQDPAMMPQQQMPAQAAPQVRSLSVLATTDTSAMQMGPALQYALAQLFNQTQYYNATPQNYALPGFTDIEVTRAFQTVGSEIISFAYLENERLSLFLFDALRPRDFIVVSQVLVDPMLGNQVTQQVVEYKFRLAFNDLLTAYYQNQYQPLPGTKVEQQQAQVAADDPKRRAEESRVLFRELSALQETKYYLGANIGMARYAGTGTGSASNVNFGAFGGYKMNDKTRLELGLDIFSYALLRVGGQYKIPFAEKYMSLYGNFGGGMVLGTIAGPRFDFEPGLSNGAMVFGPGISFDVPLLGANVRGGLNFFFGSGSILIGYYGITYNI